MPAEGCRTVIESPAVRDFRKALSAVPTDIPRGKLRAQATPVLASRDGSR
jgi:hypothetical protein